MRRLRQYGTEGDWTAAVLDACGAFAGRAALLTLREGVATLRAARGLDLPTDLTFPSDSASAFPTVLQMKDSLVALRTRS